MPVNALTTQAGLRIGPIVFETLLKHYFERFTSTQTHAEGSTSLRKEELLYDEAFNVCKAFLEAASYSTVEEVQEFCNTRTPSPPWVHVVRLLVPMSCCDEAAKVLIKALGGEDQARRITGGLKWWQVRGVQGVDAQWITAKEDWKEQRRREKERTKEGQTASQPKSSEDHVYEAEMDDMKCILYSHGGGYYFGSIDQERYSIQRHARKINGRVFAINYRLAPQYPFPCALQDLVAAYLFLIQPPEGAAHRPVKPSNIIIMGDSAGGGLSLALLQVIRDTGLPAPGGGVLISPWCDLTHSFPSIHTNGATDVIPEFGLSLQKPSPLWPPPSPEVARDLRLSLKQRLKQTLHPLTRQSSAPASPLTPLASPTAPLSENGHPGLTPMPSQASVDIGTTTAIPSIDLKDQTIRLIGSTNEPIVIDHQVHLYAQNSQIIHPLISPGLSYLGGLPPLFFIVSDKEVLRDEIIYTAHKAAHPEAFPIRDDVRGLYPPIANIETRYGGSPVHLQVYDDCAHVLPVLFSFTTPAKYCFRAIASFCRHVTGAPQKQVSKTHSPSRFPTRASSVNTDNRSSFHSLDTTREDSRIPKPATDQGVRKASSFRVLRRPSFLAKRSSKLIVQDHSAPSTPVTPNMPVLPSTPVTAATPMSPSSPVTPISPVTEEPAQSVLHSDVAGPRFNPKPSPAGSTDSALVRTAGDPVVYSENAAYPPMKLAMIRERVSTRGVIRALEPESEVEALQFPPADIGVLSERVARRFISGRIKFEKKFPQAHKMVEKQRKRNLHLANKDAERKSSLIKNHVESMPETNGSLAGKPVSENGVLTALEPGAVSRGWAWFMDGDEHPPPSSITARQDTVEARRLAKIADQAVLAEEHSFTANNIWSTVVDFLTVTAPPKARKSEAAEPALGSS